MTEHHKPEVDDVTGVATTGHAWDGIRELNTPLPRWWLITWYISIVWAVVYWVAMPAWPLISENTKGLLGYSQRATVLKQVEDGKAFRAEKATALKDASLDDIKKNANLLEFAMASGKAAFGDNCAPCHGTGATGSKGYPNLNDDDWIWGGSLDAIQTTLKYGIRSGHDEERTNDMAAYGKDEILEPAQIKAVAEYVYSLNGLAKDVNTKLLGDGKAIFAENCASCHGDKGEGMQDMGAPNLTDAIWLFGGKRADIISTIHNGRKGVMPAWDGRLDPVTIKSLAVYVHSLGGGQ